MAQSIVENQSRSGVVRGTVIALVASVVANVLVFLIGDAGDATQVVAMGDTTPSDLPLAVVIVASVIPVIVGGVGLWVLQKVTARGFQLWAILVTVLTVASIAGPIALEVDTASKVVLSVMHVVVGGAAVAGQLIARRP
jgi:hypothetical protein